LIDQLSAIQASVVLFVQLFDESTDGLSESSIVDLALDVLELSDIIIA
jgi:hypothetical protein